MSLEFVYRWIGGKIKENRAPKARVNKVMFCVIFFDPSSLRPSTWWGCGKEYLAGATRIASEGGTGVVSLNAAEAGKLVGINVDLLTKANFPSRTTQEGDTVGIEGFVDGGSAGLSSVERNIATLSPDHLFLGFALPTLAKRLNDSRFHGKLDQIERKEPDNIPNPDDPDPSTLDGVDLREAPIGVSGNDTGHNLCNDESHQQRIGRSLSEEESVSTSDENQSLRDNGNLKVNDHMDLRVVGIFGRPRSISESRAEFVEEEVGVQDSQHETDGRHGEIQSVSNRISENLSQVP